MPFGITRIVESAIIAIAHVFFALNSLEYKYDKKKTYLIFGLYLLFFVLVSSPKIMSLALNFLLTFVVYLVLFFLTLKGSFKLKSYIIFIYTTIFTFLFSLSGIIVVHFTNKSLASMLSIILFDIFLFIFIKYILQRFIHSVKENMHYFNSLWLASFLFFILIFIQGIAPFTASLDRPLSVVIFILSGLSYMICLDVMSSNFKVRDEYQKKSEENKSLANIAYIDALTGLLNKRSLEDYFNLLSNDLNKASDIKIIALDIDKFKEVNDTYGHARGDEVLKEVAKSIKDCFYFTNYHSFRTGGDEFVIVALNAEISQIERNLAKMNELLAIKNGLRISSGVAKLNYLDQDPFRTTLKQADRKMYEDKLSKRDNLK